MRDMDGLVNHNVIYLAGQRVIIRKCTTNGGIGFSAKGGVISFDNNKQMSEAKPETLVALIPVFLPPLGPVPHSFPGFLSCQCLAFSAAENLAYTDFFGVVLVLNSSDLVDVSLRNKPPLSELDLGRPHSNESSCSLQVRVRRTPREMNGSCVAPHGQDNVCRS